MGLILDSILEEYFKLLDSFFGIGVIETVSDGTARVLGLDGCKSSELIDFISETGSVIKGMALNLEKDFVGTVIFGED